MGQARGQKAPLAHFGSLPGIVLLTGDQQLVIANHALYYRLFGFRCLKSISASR